MKYERYQKFRQQTYQMLGKTKDATFELMDSVMTTRNASCDRRVFSLKDFNTNNKSEIYIKDTLPNAPRCKICNGFIHKNSISIDHKQRKQDGGLANIDNGQLTHPYCNTGYKN